MPTLTKLLLLIAIVVFGANHAFAQPATLKSEELDQLVAPIALYPDTLLSQVLIASTYPLEIVEAERGVSSNKSLKGDALKKAVDQKKWDDSIEALTATPDVLDMMSGKLEWTQKLGDAVLARQPDVMDAIQRLRQKAQANEKLTTTKQQKVSTVQQSGRGYIVIEPAAPQTVYVPYYDPAVVYGAWPYPEYPPYYFPSPGYITGGMLATGIAFATGVAVGAWATAGNWWGGGFNWGNNNINVDNDIDINKRKNSSPGKKDALYWPAAANEPRSPLGESFALATIQGYRPGAEARPYHGYFYRIPTWQGANVPGGEMSYLVNGNLIGGIALLAYPAEYGNSGVMTFLVNHSGVILQKDLGPNTARIAERMTAFNPDLTCARFRRANWL